MDLNDDTPPGQGRQATAPTVANVQPEFSPSLSRFLRLVSNGLIGTGVLWIFLPIILVGGGMVFITGLHLHIVCSGLLMVLFSVPILLAGWFLRQHTFFWLVYPGAVIAIIGGLVPLGSLLMSFNGILNEFRHFPPRDVGSRFGLAMILAIALVGPLSVVVGVCGMIAAVRAQRALRSRGTGR